MEAEITNRKNNLLLACVNLIEFYKEKGGNSAKYNNAIDTLKNDIKDIYTMNNFIKQFLTNNPFPASIVNNKQALKQRVTLIKQINDKLTLYKNVAFPGIITKPVSAVRERWGDVQQDKPQVEPAGQTVEQQQLLQELYNYIKDFATKIYYADINNTKEELNMKMQLIIINTPDLNIELISIGLIKEVIIFCILFTKFNKVDILKKRQKIITDIKTFLDFIFITNKDTNEDNIIINSEFVEKYINIITLLCAKSVSNNNMLFNIVSYNILLLEDEVLRHNTNDTKLYKILLYSNKCINKIVLYLCKACIKLKIKNKAPETLISTSNSTDINFNGTHNLKLIIENYYIPICTFCKGFFDNLYYNFITLIFWEPEYYYCTPTNVPKYKIDFNDQNTFKSFKDTLCIRLQQTQDLKNVITNNMRTLKQDIILNNFGSDSDSVNLLIQLETLYNNFLLNISKNSMILLNNIGCDINLLFYKLCTALYSNLNATVDKPISETIPDLNTILVEIHTLFIKVYNAKTLSCNYNNSKPQETIKRRKFRQPYTYIINLPCLYGRLVQDTMTNTMTDINNIDFFEFIIKNDDNINNYYNVNKLPNYNTHNCVFLYTIKSIDNTCLVCLYLLINKITSQLLICVEFKLHTLKEKSNFYTINYDDNCELFYILFHILYIYYINLKKTNNDLTDDNLEFIQETRKRQEQDIKKNQDLNQASNQYDDEYKTDDENIEEYYANNP